MDSIHADQRWADGRSGMPRTAANRKGRWIGFVILGVVPATFLIASCGPVGRGVDPTDRGDELIQVQAAEDSEAAKPQTYSIRVYREWFGFGRTCVGAFQWRTSGKASVRKWRISGDKVCDDGDAPDDSGWRTGKVAVRLGSTSEYVATGVVPPETAAVRVTRLSDGVSHQEPTREVDGRDGRFFALWRPGFLPGKIRAVQAFNIPPEVRVTLLDANGKELAVPS